MKFYHIKIVAFFSLILASAGLNSMEKEQPQLPYIDLTNAESTETVLQKTKQIKALGLTVKDVLQAQCDKEVDTHFEKVMQELKMTDGERENFQDKFEHFKLNCKLTSPYYHLQSVTYKDLKREIEELMMHHEINPNAVKIVHSESSIGAGVGQGTKKPNVVTVADLREGSTPGILSKKFYEKQFYEKHCMVYNKYFLQRYFTTSEILYGIILHEIMHLTHFDSIKKDLLEEIIAAKKYSLAKPASYPALSKAMELRADIMAASHGIDIAHSANRTRRKYASNMLPFRIPMNYESQDHPSLAKRIKAIDAVIAYLEAEKDLEQQPNKLTAKL